MSETASKTGGFRGFAQRHGKLMLLGFLVMLIPFAIATTSVDHAQKMVRKLMVSLAPGLEGLGTAGVQIGTVLLVLAVTWGVGLLMVRTALGRRLLAWEEAKFGNSPLLPKKLKQKRKKKEKEERLADVGAVLARIGGDWQPGVVVEGHEGGWVTVFVPQIPDVTTGRLYCLPNGQTRRLDTPLEEFRHQLMAHGQGATSWLEALSGASAAE